MISERLQIFLGTLDFNIEIYYQKITPLLHLQHTIMTLVLQTPKSNLQNNFKLNMFQERIHMNNTLCLYTPLKQKEQ